MQPTSQSQTSLLCTFQTSHTEQSVAIPPEWKHIIGECIWSPVRGGRLYSHVPLTLSHLSLALAGDDEELELFPTVLDYLHTLQAEKYTVVLEIIIKNSLV